MKLCTLCKKRIDIAKYFTRTSTCPACGRDLHICLNCKFYSESSHNRCIEPKAEFQRTRDKANFCDYFLFKENNIMISADTEKEDARKRLENLFKK